VVDIITGGWLPARQTLITLQTIVVVRVGVAVAVEVWREEWGKAEAEVALCSGAGSEWRGPERVRRNYDLPVPPRSSPSDTMQIS